jgi:hypothetical protein
MRNEASCGLYIYAVALSEVFENLDVSHLHGSYRLRVVIFSRTIVLRCSCASTADRDRKLQSYLSWVSRFVSDINGCWPTPTAAGLYRCHGDGRMTSRTSLVLMRATINGEVEVT